MEEDLPLEYDAIVIGTGMTESIVAAALSRIGKRVLHLDSNDHYGGTWASFNFENMLRFIDETADRVGLANVTSEWCLKERIPIKSDDNIENNQENESNGASEITIQTESSDEKAENSTDSNEKSDSDRTDNSDSSQNKNTEEPSWTRESVLKEYRKFNIDLAPKLLFARGDLVELLISSNIARYSEFRCVNRVLTWINNTLEPVPCSRADVFATKHVSIVEKRMLMKLLTSLMEYEDEKSSEYYDNELTPFHTFLKSRKLTDNLIHYVLYAIANGTVDTPCREGILKCKKFLSSLGRYGNTPFLWSMYGCGELPQGFCRLCAVYGGIYYLNRPIDKIEIAPSSPDTNKTIKIRSNDKELSCEHVVIAAHEAPREFISDKQFSDGISRGVFVINDSVLSSNKETLTLLKLPPLEGKTNPITVIELGPSTYSCPKGLYLLHMTCKKTVNAKEDLFEYAEKLLSFEAVDAIVSEPIAKKPHKKPQVLWCLYFNMTDTNVEDINVSPYKNLHLCSGPDIELDFDSAVRQARSIFNNICPEMDFLPRAPDPDEIVFDDDEAPPGPVFEKDIVKTPDTSECTKNATDVADATENIQE